MLSPPENVKARQTGRGGVRARARRVHVAAVLLVVGLAAARAHTSPASGQGGLYIGGRILRDRVVLAVLLLLIVHPTITTRAIRSSAQSTTHSSQFHTNCR